MPKLVAEFTCRVAVQGYQLMPIGSPDEPDYGVYLVARGFGPFQHHNPLEFNPALFRLFANLPETAEACLDFASKFGLLLDERPNLDRKTLVYQDSLDLWFSEIRRFRAQIVNWDHARETGEDILVSLRRFSMSVGLSAHLIDRGGKPAISIRPDNLLSAMQLQFYQVVAGITEIQECENCGTWFECGHGGTRRRASRFCSDTCRFTFHNARKNKAGAPRSNRTL